MRTLSLMARGVGVELPRAAGSQANRTPWRGILCTVDAPSLKPPGGSHGRRIILTRAAAERALPSLVGAPVNAADNLGDHDRSQPVGAVLKAYIEGQNLVVEGILYARNFPQLVATIQRHKDQLGLSFEVTDCVIENEAAGIWTLTSCTFHGASILTKQAAAYGAATSIAAAAATPRSDYAGILRTLRERGSRFQLH